MGLTFYVNPSNAAALLPAPVELSAHEKEVLNATRSYKSSYGGRDRYDMAQSAAQYGKNAGAFPSREQWEAAKAALMARGFLNKAGAITVKGKNALSA